MELYNPARRRGFFRIILATPCPFLRFSTKDTEDKKPEHSKENRKATGDHRTGEIRKKTFVPLFLLKETEEAKEESHEQRKKTWGKTGETTEPEKKLETKEKS